MQGQVSGTVGFVDGLRRTPSGTAVVSFVLYDKRKLADGTEASQRVRVTCWKELAETAAAKVVAKQLVRVEFWKGWAEAYIARDGNPGATIEVTANAITVWQGRDSAGQSIWTNIEKTSEGPRTDPAPTQSPYANDWSRQQAPPPGFTEESDIPF